MKSHTVPKKLLKNFAYDDPVTGSKRLWRYRKGMAPHGNATPKTATRWDGHFADPANTAKEAELETRLEREFEHPVNQFLDFIGYSTFFWEAKHIRALTGYVTMLFTRSRARRRASQIQADLMIEAMRSVVADEKKLSALISKHQVDAFWAGLDPKLVTRKVVIEVIENRIREASTPDNGQRQYINSMETMMRFSDLHLLNGQWGVIPADNGKRFVIGDAPVVTWVRTENNMLNFGQGFARPDVEAFLPVSPMACLRILPHVQRTRPPLRPTTDEINMAQAAFATEHCFTNVRDEALNQLLQSYFGTVRIGIEGFSIRHIDYNESFFKILMGQQRAA